jgi:hypothetical protein
VRGIGEGAQGIVEGARGARPVQRLRCGACLFLRAAGSGGGRPILPGSSTLVACVAPSSGA